MKRFIPLILTLLCLLPLGAKGVKETPVIPSGRSLDSTSRFTIALPKGEDKLFLNPIRATDASSLLLLEGLYEGLYSTDPQTGDPIQALAKEVVVSNDGLKWTFTLDERGRFSNGEPITAQGLIDSWFSLFNDDTYLATLLDVVEGVSAFRQGNSSRGAVAITAPNSTTIEMRLKYPAPYLPALLATLPFAAIYPNVSPSGDLVTSGAYEIAEESDEKIVLAKQIWYRDWEGVKSDFIEITFMESEELVQAFSDGLVDWSVAFLPPQNLKRIDDLRLSVEYSTGFYYFSSLQEAYRDSRVRRALALLIPWEELRSESHQIFPTSYLIPDLERPPRENYPAASMTEAYTLLADAGYPYGAGLPQLNMAIHKGASYAESGERIANIWSRALGITVTLDVVPLAMYSRFPSLSPYDFSFITWVGDFHDPLSFLLLFSGESDYNLGNYVSNEYDALLAKAMAATENGERTTLLIEAEEFLFKEALVFPLFHGLTTNIIDSQRVRGWYDNPLDIHPLKYLYTLAD
jgi:peptide/nickel transport system substrate-binding protein/oligopeptide transport system substrate-binding protein